MIRPLDEEGLSRLEALLEASFEQHGGMPLEMVDGLFSALIVGPGRPQPAQALQLIWGEGGVLEEAAGSQEAVELAMGLWNRIAQRVAAEPPDGTDEAGEEAYMQTCTPLIAWPANLDLSDPSVLEEHAALPLGAAWAAGFLTGVSLQAEAWQDWIEEEPDLAEDLEALHRLAVIDDDHARELDVGEDERMDLADRIDLIWELPVLLHELHLRRLVRAGAAPTETGEAACPCGSGRPFRRCCGAPERLN
ncbi:MAG: hypothetical protein KatS3mg126_1269 [Lysobacteraceae bacterium]|nr:MAG: hypothetical protein KatS3mg126_1269 [Xanthomonadaceae bacterium]